MPIKSGKPGLYAALDSLSHRHGGTLVVWSVDKGLLTLLRTTDRDSADPIPPPPVREALAPQGIKLDPTSLSGNVLVVATRYQGQRFGAPRTMAAYFVLEMIRHVDAVTTADGVVRYGVALCGARRPCRRDRAPRHRAVLAPCGGCACSATRGQTARRELTRSARLAVPHDDNPRRDRRSGPQLRDDARAAAAARRRRGARSSPPRRTSSARRSPRSRGRSSCWHEDLEVRRRSTSTTRAGGRSSGPPPGAAAQLASPRIFSTSAGSTRACRVAQRAGGARRDRACRRRGVRPVGAGARGSGRRSTNRRAPVWAQADPGSVARVVRILLDNACESRRRSRP